MKTPDRRLRDQMRDFLPWWLSDRRLTSGKTVGFRVMWVMVAMLDVFIDWLVQGLLAWLPGVGTRSALPLIARSRGILRGRYDTDETFTARLRLWLEKWRRAGSMQQIATELREYLGVPPGGTAPRIRIFSRNGIVYTLESNGTSSLTSCVWDWDSVSHPWRSHYWSDLFVVFFTTPFAQHTRTLGDGTLVGNQPDAIGHTISRIDYNACRGLFQQWKAQHTCIRAVIFTVDPALFDPAVPMSLPNGQWGDWGTTGAAARGFSSRDLLNCRYWEL